MSDNTLPNLVGNLKENNEFVIHLVGKLEENDEFASKSFPNIAELETIKRKKLVDRLLSLNVIGFESKIDLYVKLFIDRLKIYENPMEIFIVIFIKYYLNENFSEIEITAKLIGYNKKTIISIINKYKNIINSNEFEAFLSIIPIFGINLKEAKSTISKLSGNEIKISTGINKKKK